MLRSPEREDGRELNTAVDGAGKKIQVSQTVEPRGPGVHRSGMARLRNCRPAMPARPVSAPQGLPWRSALKPAIGCGVAMIYHVTPVSSRPLSQKEDICGVLGTAGKPVESCMSLVMLPAQRRCEPLLSQRISVNSASTGCESQFHQGFPDSASQQHSGSPCARHHVIWSDIKHRQILSGFGSKFRARQKKFAL